MQLASTESILQEATSSMSLVTQFEQEVATLQRIMHDIQTSEEMLTQKMKSLNEKFQNVTDFWKRSLEEKYEETLEKQHFLLLEHLGIEQSHSAVKTHRHI